MIGLLVCIGDCQPYLTYKSCVPNSLSQSLELTWWRLPSVWRNLNQHTILWSKFCNSRRSGGETIYRQCLLSPWPNHQSSTNMNAHVLLVNFRMRTSHLDQKWLRSKKYCLSHKLLCRWLFYLECFRENMMCLVVLLNICLLCCVSITKFKKSSFNVSVLRVLQWHNPWTSPIQKTNFMCVFSSMCHNELIGSWFFSSSFWIAFFDRDAMSHEPETVLQEVFPVVVNTLATIFPNTHTHTHIHTHTHNENTFKLLLVKTRKTHSFPTSQGCLHVVFHLSTCENLHVQLAAVLPSKTESWYGDTLPALKIFKRKNQYRYTAPTWMQQTQWSLCGRHD